MVIEYTLRGVGSRRDVVHQVVEIDVTVVYPIDPEPVMT